MIKGTQEIYYLIRDGRNTMYMTSGKSESNAWVNAKKYILEREQQYFLLPITVANMRSKSFH